MSDDDDLQLEPMYKGRARAIAIGVGLAVVAGGAIVVNARINAGRRDAELARAGAAWSALERCLVGDAMPASERPSRRVRQIELAAQQTARANESQPRARRWPYRCATHAGVLTHALFESKSDERDHRMLAMLASRAATALEAGELRTGANDRLTYVDELFEQARRASLPAPAAPAAGPLPPAPATPLTPRTMTALFAGAEANEVLGTDPVAGASLTLLTGQTRRRVCALRGRADAPARALTTARCAELPFADAPLDARLVGADDGASPHVLVRAAGAPAGNLFSVDRASGGAVYQGAAAAYVRADGALTVLARDAAAPPTGARRPATAPTYTLARVTAPAGAPPRTAPVSPPFADAALLAGPVLLPEWLLVAAGTPPAPSPVAPRPGAALDAGLAPPRDAAAVTADASAADATTAGPPARVIAGALAAGETPAVTFTELGAGPPLAGGAHETITLCRTPQAVLAAVRGAGDAVAVTALENGRWSAPVSTTAPATAALTCRGAQATLTWTDAVLVRQAHCTAAGCRTAQGPLPQYDNTRPLVAAIGDRLLVVASPGPHRGLVARIAPLEELDRVDDVIVIDDADHGGLALEAPRYVYSRGEVAVVLVTSTGIAAETYAVRLALDGTFSVVEPSAAR